MPPLIIHKTSWNYRVTAHHWGCSCSCSTPIQWDVVCCILNRTTIHALRWFLLSVLKFCIAATTYLISSSKTSCKWYLEKYPTATYGSLSKSVFAFVINYVPRKLIGDHMFHHHHEEFCEFKIKDESRNAINRNQSKLRDAIFVIARDSMTYKSIRAMGMNTINIWNRSELARNVLVSVLNPRKPFH